MNENEIVMYQDAVPSEQIARINVDLTTFAETATGLQAQADRAEISTSEDYAKGGDLIKIARTESAKVEDLRVQLSGPLNKLVKFVNAQFKVPKEAFTDVRSTIERKMLIWKAAEDRMLRVAAEKARKKLEDEALAQAALETKEEDQEAVLDAAADAGETIVKEQSTVGLQRGNYGSSTNTKKIYTTNVYDVEAFLGGLMAHMENGNARSIDLGGLIQFRTAGMNKLAESCFKAGVTKMPGADFTETEKIRVY